ncbi:MAG: hypothetical protein Q8R32_00470 [bacterium]|nr:hypothetical protein [bacterium]
MCHAHWGIVLLLCASLGFSQTKTVKDPQKPPEVEVHFADGSIVRMTVLQESLEIQTKYGTLAVPVRDVRRLELGLHMPKGVGERIDAAVRKLGSTSFREREDATHELVTLGAYSYPAVHAASRSSDLEVAQRAAAVIKKLREKLPADQLRLNPRDKIQTAEFPAVGRLTSSTIKARNVYFGEIELKLCELRSIRWMGVGGETELLVEAAKHGSPGSSWFDTGVDIEAETTLLIVVSGEVDLWPATPGQYKTGPTGYRNAAVIQGIGHHAGTLLGRIGDKGKVFPIGERHEATSQQEGRLFLAIAPSPWNNVSGGSYTVRVKSERR